VRVRGSAPGSRGAGSETIPGCRVGGRNLVVRGQQRANALREAAYVRLVERVARVEPLGHDRRVQRPLPAVELCGHASADARGHVSLGDGLLGEICIGSKGCSMLGKRIRIGEGHVHIMQLV
jgi:hypothetical protein